MPHRNRQTPAPPCKRKETETESQKNNDMKKGKTTHTAVTACSRKSTRRKSDSSTSLRDAIKWKENGNINTNQLRVLVLFFGERNTSHNDKGTRVGLDGSGKTTEIENNDYLTAMHTMQYGPMKNQSNTAGFIIGQ